MDIDMRSGSKFPVVLEERLAQSKVLLALIGPHWFEARDKDGQRRLDNPEDWVRLEISRALARQITVIPVCINQAKLPEKASLPEEIRGLVDHQAAFVNTSSFRNDMAGLARDIRSIPDPIRGRRIGLLAAGLLLLAVGVILLLVYVRRSPPAANQPSPVLSSSFRSRHSGRSGAA
jgi:hypothetical protein